MSTTNTPTRYEMHRVDNVDDMHSWYAIVDRGDARTPQSVMVERVRHEPACVITRALNEQELRE